MKRGRIYKTALKLACKRLATLELECEEHCINCDKYFDDETCSNKMFDYYLDKARKELEQ